MLVRREKADVQGPGPASVKEKPVIAVIAIGETPIGPLTVLPGT